MQRVALASIIFFASSTFASVWAQDCSQLRPDRSVDTEIRDKAKADANILLKSLGSGTLDNDYNRIVKNQPFQDVDETHRWDSFLYMVCSILSTSNLSPDNKIDRLEKLYLLKQQGPPTPSPGAPANPTTPSAQSTPGPHPASPDSQLVVRCTGKGNDTFSQQVCDHLGSFRNSLDKLAAQVGASAIEVSISSEQHHASGFFSGTSLSNAAMFNTHWVGVKRPDTVIALSYQETGNAWNAAQEFVQRLQNVTVDAHQ